MTYLVIYISDNCQSCRRVVDVAEQFALTNNNISLEVKNIEECERNVSIVPAVFIDDNLYCYGDFDSYKLNKFIKKKLNN